MNEPESTLLDWSEPLARQIRGGSWAEQGVATYRLILVAVDSGDWVVAEELTDYFMVEAGVCFKIYRQWSRDIGDLLIEWGVAKEEVENRCRDLARLLAHPDGRGFDPEEQWGRVEAARDATRSALQAHDTGTSLAELENLVEQWRQCHDRDVDLIAGLMNEVVERFGEPALGRMYDAILVPWFNERYALFDVDDHEWVDAMHLNLQVAFEAMRGHLCGPGRRGDVEFEERGDRYVLSFDPCGSGGRQVRGDEIEGTPPRHESPYAWPLTQEPAVLNHFEPGVCHYCAHCILLTEVMPMRAFGYPVRAVDPPRLVADGQPPQKCSWTVFKDPEAVPEEYYTRVGMTRPEQIGSRACGGDPTLVT